MKFKNGYIYDGEFRGDKIHGKGKIIKDGKVVKDSYWELVNPETFIEESRVTAWSEQKNFIFLLEFSFFFYLFERLIIWDSDFKYKIEYIKYRSENFY